MATLWCDYRKGSCEFQAPLRKLGIDARLETLDSADFAFQGNGPDGLLEIAVERKALSDLVTSLRDGRLVGMSTETSKGGQLPRLLTAYDMPWLLIEGRWKPGKTGGLVTDDYKKRPLPGSFTEDSLEKQLLSIYIMGGLSMHRTADKHESARWLATLFRWWTDKTWDQHQTLKVVHQRVQTLMPVSVFREMTFPLPGVGLAGSKALEKAFEGSIGRLLAAPTFALAEVEVRTPQGPRKLGFSKARKLRDVLDTLK